MDWELTKEEYENHQVAREGDDEGYGIFSGYVAVVVDENKAAIVYASHCSCYGTWDGDSIDGGNLVWSGTLNELLAMARQKADPDMPSRVLLSDDYSGPHLLALYSSLLQQYGSRE
jgi:hypothetical protein